MTLLFDKHHPIVSPQLAPAEPFDGVDIEQSGADPVKVIEIGLINNMPDAAIEATERQFSRLLISGAGAHIVRLHCFSLPSVQRSEAARARLERLYTDINDLQHTSLHGLIVTGAEPRTSSLRDEPYWTELTEIVDWAQANTRSAIWSCLAAHAAVLHLDGVRRHRLDNKCSGLFDCAASSEDWLTRDLMAPLKVSHSRLNELKENELAAAGYQVVTHSAEAGVDIFVKDGRSRSIFFQGHPEYDPLSLQREYLRDVGRFLAGERRDYPDFPINYFDETTEADLEAYRNRALRTPSPAMITERPPLTLRASASNGAGGAVTLFRNWLDFLSAQDTN